MYYQPLTADRRHRQDDLSLKTANITSIVTYGKRSLTVNLGLRRTFQWVLIAADVQNPILGADFLSYYSYYSF